MIFDGLVLSHTEKLCITSYKVYKIFYEYKNVQSYNNIMFIYDWFIVSENHTIRVYDNLFL